eukprot:7995135-Prorocentrum_lima.AAC.1
MLPHPAPPATACRRVRVSLSIKIDTVTMIGGSAGHHRADHRRAAPWEASLPPHVAVRMCIGDDDGSLRPTSCSHPGRGVERTGET